MELQYLLPVGLPLAHVLREQLDKGVDAIQSGMLSPRKENDDLAKELRQHHEEVLRAIQLNGWRSDNIEHINNFSNRLNEGVEVTSEIRFRSLILAHLTFSDMRDRYEGIPQAHQRTFQWIYHPPKARVPQKWDNFVAFLESSAQGNLYWIAGKAGSGKSTLMKYIYDHPQTRACLLNWANGAPLVATGFFFWNSGTAMQMSRLGLLQSLLHQIFSWYPELITEVFRSRWEAYTAMGGGQSKMIWNELKHAFETVISNETLRFALFLDGLDEFDGDHGELIELMDSAASRDNVKVCLASRPWLVFEDAFESKPSLLLEHLTGRDIRQYVEDKFSQSNRYQKLNMSEPHYARNLIDSIVEKSSGVFLWVYLVVRSLLDGLVNADRVSDLQRRLDSLPRDLEDLFKKLLKGVEVESFYFTHACQMLSLVFEARTPPTLLTFSFADEEDEKMILTAKPGPLPDAEKADLFENTRRRLNSRCKGLLEVKQPSGKPKTVWFLHRTVKDFIAQPYISSQITTAAGRDFDPHRRLANGYLRETQIEGCLYEGTLSSSVLRALGHALLRERRTGKVPVDFLDALGKSVAGEIEYNNDLHI